MNIAMNADIETEISRGAHPTTLAKIAYRQLLATERVALALEKLVTLSDAQHTAAADYNLRVTRELAESEGLQDQGA